MISHGAETPSNAAPIARVREKAVGLGWIPSSAADCLYVSAGSDTRPLTYLRPEVLGEMDLVGHAFPQFFVLIDKAYELEKEGGRLDFRDRRTEIEALEHFDTELAGAPALLSRVLVSSDRFDDRHVVVLQVEATNEGFAGIALSERWSPTWFVGVRDGCAFGGNSRCENETRSIPRSIPLRLGVRYWLTDHLTGIRLLDGDRQRLRRPGLSLPLPEGGRLRELAAWRRWPEGDFGPDRWVSLYEVISGPESVNETALRTCKQPALPGLEVTTPA